MIKGKQIGQNYIKPVKKVGLLSFKGDSYEESSISPVAAYNVDRYTQSLYFRVTDYFGTSIKDAPIEVSGNDITSDTSDLKTDGDGVFRVTRVAEFRGGDVEHNLKININVPAKAGVYRDSYYSNTQNVKRVATGNEKIWIKACGHGTTFDKTTYTAPNGITLSDKGGIIGFIGYFKVKFYDIDGNLISEDTKKVATAQEKSINVPEGAFSVVYTLDINADLRDPKIVTEQIPVGDAAVYFEGPLGSKNCHIAAMNLNGNEILRESK